MSPALRISLLIGIVIYVAAILYFLKRKTISLKYSLLWLLSAIILLIMVVFPKFIESISHLIGVESVVNGIFLLFIFFILLILIALTAIVSKQHKQIKALTQALAIISQNKKEQSYGRTSKGKSP